MAAESVLPPLDLPPLIAYAPPPVTKPLESGDEAALKKEMGAFFAASTNQQADWKFSAKLDQLLGDNEPAVRKAVWEVFRDTPIHEPMKDDFDAKQVRFDRHLSAYTVKTVGTRPTNGWALFIALHGGGGAPKQVNDSEWKVMRRYYRDHAELGGYRYVALRAPNDTWNGFYDVYVYPLVANLIRQFLLFSDVDPNKVFIMGYSHGGYGAFAIGPKMPDRFAAIHASASAPTDGETTAQTLRNTVFTYMIGEKDTNYGRIERCRKFDDAVQKLRAEHTNAYPVVMQFVPNNGHGSLPDRDKIVQMYPHTRNPVPTELTWLMTDKVITEFYWLHVPAAGKKREIEATYRDNHVTMTTTTNVPAVTVLLDSRSINFSKPVVVEFNGEKSSHKLQPSLRTLCETLLRRGDPELAFTAEINLAPPEPKVQ